MTNNNFTMLKFYDIERQSYYVAGDVVRVLELRSAGDRSDGFVDSYETVLMTKSSRCQFCVQTQEAES